MNILYVHGINVDEDDVNGIPLYTDWNLAVFNGLKKNGYTGNVNWTPAKYNTLFDKNPPNIFTYIEALAELIAGVIDSESMKKLRKKGQQPEPGDSQTVLDFRRRNFFSVKCFSILN